MCKDFPHCPHDGPLMEIREGLLRHCETPLSNHECQYLALGCKGCLWNPDRCWANEGKEWAKDITFTL